MSDRDGWGCWPQKNEPDSDTKKNGACLFVIPSIFSSIEELEVGLGPQGEVCGNWTIGFTEDGFQWHHSDVFEQGAYRCQGAEVNRIDGGEAGRFDTSTDILMWENVEYLCLP